MRPPRRLRLRRSGLFKSVDVAYLGLDEPGDRAHVRIGVDESLAGPLNTHSGPFWDAEGPFLLRYHAVLKRAFPDAQVLSTTEPSTDNHDQLMFHKLLNGVLQGKDYDAPVPPFGGSADYAMYLAKELTNHSLPEIGDAFGGRDRIQVGHRLARVEMPLPAGAEAIPHASPPPP